MRGWKATILRMLLPNTPLALSDEDRRTLVRWIDLGCPIDMNPQYEPTSKNPLSSGWMGDDQRPTLAVTVPQPGENEPLSRLLIGMANAYTGLEMSNSSVTADFAVNRVERQFSTRE